MQTLHSLTRQEMTRKEFLAIVGFGTASIFGFTTFLQFVGSNNPLRQTVHRYGFGPYGGPRRRGGFQA